ncbi:hypothetical protein GCM10009547_25410 [Sporichthya brevicatena]|uniref:Uncharacterized protein n=1 Tax=Sporichthya brevicatena TaxID=171442 RepID=A0ABN1GWX5_9ACTN
MADELSTVADELYGLPASDFVAARNAAAKTAKAAKAKDRDLAAAITALPKPSTSAWVVNQLVRRHPDDVDALLELGDDLRSAERARDPDRIRSLSRERNLRVPALTRQAKALAEELGQPVSASVAEEVESTLTAALATEQFGAAVRSGRLTKALFWAGFGEMPALATLVAVPSPPEKPKPAAKGKGKDDAAAKAAAEADRRVEELTATVDNLTQQLDWAKKQLTAARREAKSAARLVRDLS